MSNATQTAPATQTFVEITRQPRKPRQRRSINWLDLPAIYGQAGVEMRLTPKDKATLAYLYGQALRVNHLDGKRHRVTLTAAVGAA